METNLSETSKIEKNIKKHKNRLFVVGGGLVFAGFTFFAYKKYDDNQNEKINEEITAAVFALEDKKYSEAINGTESFVGLKEIASKHGKAKVINLVNYYLGVAYMKTENFDLAIESFKRIKFKDLIMQSMAHGLIGDSFAEKKDYDAAIIFYKKAAEEKKNNYTTPMFLLKAAAVAEVKGDIDEALGLYKFVSARYKNYESSLVKRHIARLETSLE